MGGFRPTPPTVAEAFAATQRRIRSWSPYLVGVGGTGGLNNYAATGPGGVFASNADGELELVAPTGGTSRGFSLVWAPDGAELVPEIVGWSRQVYEINDGTPPDGAILVASGDGTGLQARGYVLDVPADTYERNPALAANAPLSPVSIGYVVPTGRVWHYRTNTVVSNTAVETTVATVTLDGTSLSRKGRMVVKAAGTFARTGMPTLTARIKAGGQTWACVLTAAFSGSYVLEGDFSFSYSTQVIDGIVELRGNMGTAFNLVTLGNGSSWSASGQLVEVTLQWSAASASNTATNNDVWITLYTDTTQP